MVNNGTSLNLTLLMTLAHSWIPSPYNATEKQRKFTLTTTAKHLPFAPMINKMKTYKVEFTTAFAGCPYINIILEAEDTSHAQLVARNLCRYGFISHVTTTDKAPVYTKATHAFAYNKNFEIYS